MKRSVLAISFGLLLSIQTLAQTTASEPAAPPASQPTSVQPSQPATISKPTTQNMSECLVVRQAEGHRFRNSMIAGALTGGIGFAAGAAFSGGRYEYIDSFNVPNTKMKYKGPELQKLQQEGVHVVVVNKKALPDEIKAARESCQTK